jgi:putative transcriptional regulator
MPITYKIDVLARLKAAGYSTYRIRKDKLLGEATVQRLREHEPVSWENIATICSLLDCQPGDIMEYAEEDSSEGGQDA